LIPVFIFQLQGPYSYERIDEPEIIYERFVKDELIDAWLEHVLQNVIPYTHVRITVEVMK
jgi:hypothetical protein